MDLPRSDPCLLFLQGSNLRGTLTFSNNVITDVFYQELTASNLFKSVEAEIRNRRIVYLRSQVVPRRVGGWEARNLQLSCAAVRASDQLLLPLCSRPILNSEPRFGYDDKM